MEVYSEVITRDEIFCCSLKQIKDTFCDMYATIFLKGHNQYYIPEFRHTAIPADKIKGKIVCCACLGSLHADTYLASRFPAEFAAETASIGQNGRKLYLSFYPIKKETYHPELKKKFEETILTEIKNWYLKYKNDRRFGYYELLADWYDDKFLLHENLCA